MNQSRKSVSHQFGKKILLSETVRQQEMYLDLQLDMNFLEDSTKKKQTKPLKLQSNN